MYLNIPRPRRGIFFIYLDDWKFEETMRDSDNYFKNVKVINFDIITYECRGEPLEKDTREHFGIQNNDFVFYKKTDKKQVIGTALRNQNQTKQLIFVKKETVMNYFLNK